MKKKNTRWIVQVKAEDHGHQVVETHSIRMQMTEEQIRLMYEIFDSSDLVISAICGRRKDLESSTVGIAPYEVVLIGIEFTSTYYNYIYDWIHHTVEYYQKPERGYPLRADMERVLECLSAHLESLDGLILEYIIR